MNCSARFVCITQAPKKGRIIGLCQRELKGISSNFISHYFNLLLPVLFKRIYVVAASTRALISNRKLLCVCLRIFFPDIQHARPQYSQFGSCLSSSDTWDCHTAITHIMLTVCCVWWQAEVEAGMTALPSVRAADHWCWVARAARPVNIFHTPVVDSEVVEVVACPGVAAAATEVSRIKFRQAKCLISKKHCQVWPRSTSPWMWQFIGWSFRPRTAAALSL